jgi:hypothetical protein
LLFTFGETSATTSWLAQNGGATATEYYGLGMAEYCGDLEATRALDVHEVRVWRLYQTLKLVLALLVLRAWVKQINSKLQGIGKKQANKQTAC